MEVVILAMILWPGAGLIAEILNFRADRLQAKWEQDYPIRTARRQAIWASEGGFPRLLTSDMLEKIDQDAKVS